MVNKKNVLLVCSPYYKDITNNLIDGAKEIGMTTVRFISDPDCNEADFKDRSFDDLLNLQLSKV